MIGEQILGYRVTEVVGAGSFGTVYKVSKTNASGTYVRALKHIRIPATKQQYNSVLNSMGGDHSKADDYFAAALRETVDEIRILSLLSESGVANIVRYYENDIIETEHPKTYNIYMMMEFLTPFPKVLESRALSVGEVIRVGKDILKALISCHRQNIIHRDIKDDNIFVTGDGVYKLGDFGVSKKLQDRSRAASMRGTPNFIAPEVYLGKESYDCTVDLYSLGIVLYRLLNKLRGPFLPAFPASYTSEDENAAFEARMLGKTPELPLMAQNALGEAVRKALLPRAQRYNSAQEFLEALEEAERLLPREEWLAPAYDVFLPEGDTDAPGQADPFAADPGDQTIGGPLFDTEEDGQFRVEKNLFMTIGAEQAPQTVQSKPAAPQETVLAQEEEDLAQKLPEARQTQTVTRPVAPAVEKPAKTTGKPKKEAAAKGKNRPLIIAAACAAAVVMLITVLLLLGSPLEIAGKEVDKKASYVYFDKVTLTGEDVARLAKLKELRYIKLTDCTLSDDAISEMQALSDTLRDVEIRGCTGMTDYSCLTAIPGLTTLVLDNVNLTDSQLSGMLRNVPEKLSELELTNNPLLADLSPLASVTALEELDVSNTAVRDFSMLRGCTELRQLRAQNCGIQELRSLAELTALMLLDLANNQITDLTGLENLSDLSYLYLNSNALTDLSALRQCLQLEQLNISDNQIASLLPLADHTELHKLYASRNVLTGLEGLEQSISLKVLVAPENQISQIGGLQNCAILETVDLSRNSIQDITLLAKSVGTLQKLYFHENGVADISPLTGMTALKYLGFDRNRVTDLQALQFATGLEVLSASYNQIASLEGLCPDSPLRALYLDHNQIQDMTPILDLSGQEDMEILDLSQNQITEVLMTASRKYRVLSVYGNPVESFRADAIGTGYTLYLPYIEGEDYSALKGRFTYMVVADCPLDKQYQMNQLLLGVDYLSPYLDFQDTAALEQLLYESKARDALTAEN